MDELISEMKSDFFKALAHPTRIKIVETLLKAPEEVCVCDIVETLQIEQSNLSQHLAILRKQQIITCTKVGQKVMCKLNGEVDTLLEIVQRFLAQRLAKQQALIQRLNK